MARTGCAWGTQLGLPVHGTWPTSLSRPPVFRGLGRGKGGGPGRAGVPRRPPSLALVHAPGGCGGWLAGPGPGPPYAGFPCASGGGSALPGPRGHCLGAAISPVPCDMRVAGGACAAGLPLSTLPATCWAGADWRPRALGAARGVSSWRVSPCPRVRPCAVRRWRPVTVLPVARPGARAAGVGGGGNGGGWPRLWGSVPVGRSSRAAG